MNKPVLRLYGLVLVLFGVLVAFTSRWTVFEAEALRDNEVNRRPVLEEERIRRGTIRSEEGRVLARSVPLRGERYGRDQRPLARATHALTAPNARRRGPGPALSQSAGRAENRSPANRRSHGLRDRRR